MSIFVELFVDSWMINPECTSSPTSRSFWQMNLHLASQVATRCSNSGDTFRLFSPTATKTGFSIPTNQRNLQEKQRKARTTPLVSGLTHTVSPERLALNGTSRRDLVRPYDNQSVVQEPNGSHKLTMGFHDSGMRKSVQIEECEQNLKNRIHVMDIPSGCLLPREHTEWH